LPNLAPSKQTLFNPRTQSSPTRAPTVAPPIIEVKAPIWLSAPASQWPCLRSPHSLGKTRHESERRNGMNPAVGAIKLWSTPRLARIRSRDGGERRDKGNPSQASSPGRFHELRYCGGRNCSRAWNRGLNRHVAIDHPVDNIGGAQPVLHSQRWITVLALAHEGIGCCASLIEDACIFACRRRSLKESSTPCSTQSSTISGISSMFWRLIVSKISAR
jgi:hypothetical protein